MANEGLNGGVEVLNRIKDICEKQMERAEVAATVEFTIEMQESQRRTPVESGDLRDSHELEVTREGNDIEARIIVGGDLPYAVKQHYDLELQHPHGGQALFLESTVVESEPYMAERIARRITL